MVKFTAVPAVSQFIGCCPRGIPLTSGLEQRFKQTDVKAEIHELVLYSFVILEAGSGIELEHDRQNHQKNENARIYRSHLEAGFRTQKLWRQYGQKRNFQGGDDM